MFHDLLIHLSLFLSVKWANSKMRKTNPIRIYGRYLLLSERVERIDFLPSTIYSVCKVGKRNDDVVSFGLNTQFICQCQDSLKT